jgi:AhpD family alkylhydroperoxidase
MEGMMRKLRSLPEQPVMRDLYRAYPATSKPLGEFTEAAMRGPSPFTQGQRELIAAYVSGLNACAYCHDTHVGVAAACGVAPDLCKQLLADVETRSTLRSKAHIEAGQSERSGRGFGL